MGAIKDAADTIYADGERPNKRAIRDLFDLVEARSTAWASVIGYGARGDGATDDTAAIHAARDAVGVGGVVYFPGGTYIADQLAPNIADQTWLGDDRAIVKLKDGTGGLTNLIIIGAGGVHFRRLRFDGNRDNEGAGSISCGAFEGIAFEDCEFYEFGSYPIYAPDTPGLKVRRTKIYDCSNIAIHNTISVRTSAMPGPILDKVEVDYSGEPTSYNQPAIIVRGTSSYDVLDVDIDIKVRMVDDPDDSGQVAIETRYVKRGRINVQSRGGSMCLSLVATREVSGVLNGCSWNHYGLEYGGDNCANCHFTGVLDGRDEAGTARGLNALAYQGTGGSNINCRWTGVLRGTTSSRLINLARGGGQNGASGSFYCDGSNYVLLDSAVGAFDLSGYFNGGSAGDVVAALSGSTGGVRVSGKADGFDDAACSITGTTAITINDVSLDGLEVVDCSGGGFVTALSGGAALGEQVTAVGCAGQYVGGSGFLCDIVNLKRAIYRFQGAGSPESALSAGVGSTFQRNDGSAGALLYLKDSGTGNTGWAAVPRFTQGTYTPTLTGVANVAASTAYSCTYVRIGDRVTVTGRVDIDPTSTGNTQLGISLPVASNFAGSQQGAGCAGCAGVAGQSAGVYADATNDRMTLEFNAADTSNRDWYFSFTYQVV